MDFLQRLQNAVARRVLSARANLTVRRASQVIHGPAKVSLGADGCGLVTLMKDASYYVAEFIRHHQALGAKHILIIDNGSSDNTVQIAQRFANVTILRNTSPARDYECLIRVISARQVYSGGWLLFADADELFEVPLATGTALPRLVSYLNTQGYTSMVTQMLDLSSPLPYGQTKALDYPSTLAVFRQYSLDQITRVSYHDQMQVGFNWFLRSNICDDPEVRLQIGGLRREVFGENCFLSKHSLVRNITGPDPMPHPHCAMGVRVADVTGLIRHYKLAGPYLDRDRKTVARGTWSHAEDRQRLDAARAGDDFAIKPEHPQEYEDTSRLLDQGFLTASARYRTFMA